MATSKHNPADINKKLKNLTPAQAKAFGEALAHSNDGFFAAEKKNAKKSPAKKSGK
nr:MAG TPA: hypothetical protein [Caudoviricetes sp.]